MNRGFYTIASGMMTRQRSLNTIANNMANSKTSGYKSERIVTTTFEQEFLVRKEGSKTTPIGKGSPVNLVEQVKSDFDASMLMESESPFDIAIQNNGYFTVTKAGADGAAGTQYLTRNGKFDIDGEGFLVLPGQGRVQGKKGDIYIGGSGFTVNENGVVTDDKGKVSDTLLIQLPPEGTELTKYANGMYLAQGELTQVAAPGTSQYLYEQSNVDYNVEIALLMQEQRSFQSCAKALTTIDELNQKTVNLGNL